MSNKIFIATNNKGKLNEFEKILSDLDLEFVMIKDIPNYGEVVEDGNTFEENALIKARYGAKKSGLITLSDDSGLEVDFLNGAPGVFSARYAGENGTEKDCNLKLLKELKNVDFKDRTARYRCVIALVTPDGIEITKEGTIEGYIDVKETGNNGFGYDPMFYVPEYGKTFGMIAEDIKNKISHRGKALKNIRPELEKILR